MDTSTLEPGKRRLFNLAFLVMLVGLPALTWYVTICMLHFDGALVLPGWQTSWSQLLSHVEAPTTTSVAFYVAWLALQAALMRFGPGKQEQGVALESGKRLPYRLNGLFSLLTTVALAITLVATGALPATLLYDELGPLVTTTNLLVLLLCVYIAWLGRRQATESERARNLLEAYFVGAALNPRNGSFDWKFFCESRPGMILWVLLNLSLAAAQLREHGSVSNAMILACAFQILYVTDYFVVEDAILTTWDIRHEPFGFMLCWGSLVWVPFTFSLQPMYLVSHPVSLSWPALLAVAALNMTGYWIFRSANLQKHRFRSDPDRPIWGKPPSHIQTQRGTRLLTAGFWGLSRHSNYLGDLMMGLAWCMLCGFDRVLCYFYFIYFVILLVHRERRDNAHCARKYGDDWKNYESQVPWRIVPWLY